MVFYSVAGGRLFPLELLLLMASLHYYASFANGQQVGVSLRLHGVTISNNSLVDLQDILYTAPRPSEFNVIPTNANGLHDQTLVCVTDLVDCCDTPRTVHGDWYYPDGRVVQFDAGGTTFRANRGPYEEIDGRQFYGSVRLFRRYTPRQSGLYCCKLPSAAATNLNQTLCAGIVDFGPDFRVPPVTISPSGSTGTAGETYSLTCLTTLNPGSVPFPSDVPSPTLEWFFGPNNSSLPSGVTSMETTFNNVDTYTSTLQFSPLSRSHAGMYTCQLGPGRLANSAMITVNAPAISVQITTSGAPMLGQNGYSLSCGVNGTGNLNPTITYQWTKNNGTQSQIQVGGNLQVLSFSPLRLYDAGLYTCRATVSSPYLIDNITMMDSQDVTVPTPSVSVQITDGGATPIAGENYELVCSVSGADNLNPTITYEWTKNSDGQIQVGTNSNTLSFTPLRLSDGASYVCAVTIASSYLTGDIVAMSINPQDIRIQIPTPSSVTLGNSESNSIVIGSDVILPCTVELNSAIVETDLPLLMVDAQLFREGTLLVLTGLTVTGTTFTYTTQLNSFGRSDSGNYTCTATVRPQPTSTYLTGTEVLSSNINIEAASAPPVNVRATQSSSSASVEVSWSPPSDGAATGYRIFYGNGQNVLVSSVTVITSVSLRVDGNYLGKNVSIRSEADQLYSKIISVSVTLDNNDQCAGAIDTAMRSCSCSSEVGITVGVIIVVVCLVVMVITVTVLLYLWRKKSPNKDNFAVSANMAYGEMNLKPGEMEGEYENPDKILGKSSQGTESTTTAAYETVYTSNPAAPEYASTDEAVCATNK